MGQLRTKIVSFCKAVWMENPAEFASLLTLKLKDFEGALCEGTLSSTSQGLKKNIICPAWCFKLQVAEVKEPHYLTTQLGCNINQSVNHFICRANFSSTCYWYTRCINNMYNH